jgi:hypothetical protein
LETIYKILQIYKHYVSLAIICKPINLRLSWRRGNPCGILSTVVAKCCQWLRVTPQQIRRDKFCQTFTPISAISLWFNKKRTRKSWLERVSWTEMNGILGCCGQ